MRDEKIRAFHKTTGELLWEADLPAAGIATPAVYQANGKQYVVVVTTADAKVKPDLLRDAKVHAVIEGWNAR